jgi:hypothetical protein
MTENKLQRPHLLTLAVILLFMMAGFTLVFAVSTFANASWLAGTDFTKQLGNQLWISGLIDLVLVIALVVAGLSLLQGTKFGLYFGFIFASLNAIKWFFLLFWFPILAVVSIAIDVLIIYALGASSYYFDEYARLGLTE